MARPLALDLYCKAGGNARGLHRAGFDVIGIDIEAQPNYPYYFVRGDALKTLRELIGGRPIFVPSHPKRFLYLHDFAFIWASPPCLDNTTLRNAPNAKKHKDLIAPTRELLERTKLPYVIENVDSPLARQRLHEPFRLCGSTFGLGVTAKANPKLVARRFELRRHRLFECNFEFDDIDGGRCMVCCHHSGAPVIGVYGAHCRCRSKQFGGRGTADFVGYDHNLLASMAMGIKPGTMTLDELSNAIPPAYAEWIGKKALTAIRKRV